MDYIRELFAGLKLSPQGAAPADLDNVERSLGVVLPIDYKQFMTSADGGEGWIGASSYLMLWAAHELVARNTSYHVSEFVPGFLILGSDGGGNAYVLDSRNPGTVRYGRIPFVGMDGEEFEEIGTSFREFLERLRATV